MPRCPLCGTENSQTYPVCGYCYDAGLVDGSTEQNRLCYTLKDLLNRRWTDGDLKLVADSTAFVYLVEHAMPLMDPDMMRNLLRKVMRNL